MRHGLRAVLLAAVLAAAMTPAVAKAASVAYVDNGEVWLSSLDGAQKARLSGTVVNGEGDTEKWLDVAQSDNGRIVAVRNKPGRISNFSWFKIWEPDGSSTVEGPLNAPSGWISYVYPLGFDITADGKHLVYGYSNSSGCCPISFAHGTYVRPATNSTLPPINTSGQISSRAVRLTGHLARGRLVAVGHQRPGRGQRQPLHERLHPVARHLGGRAGPGRRRRRGQRTPGGARVRDVERRHADGRQDRRAHHPGGRSGTHLPRRRGLLPARGRHRARRIDRAGRRLDRLEGRRRRQGRGEPLVRGRPLRDGERVGRALADGRAPVDRRRRRRRVPAHVAAGDPARRPGPGRRRARPRPSPRS